MGAVMAGDLLEREDELRLLRARAASAQDGEGSVAVITGEPGVGKTALLDALLARASPAMTVMAGRAGELEREFAYGVVRQLLGPVVRRLTPPDRDRLLAGAAGFAAPVIGVSAGAEPAAAPSTVSHGLYWLLAELAEKGPLLLAVDDAHWADPASLAFLSYLGRRLEGLPVLLVLTLRPSEPGAPQDLLDTILELPGAVELHPKPLTADGTARLLARSADGPPSTAVAHACHNATGGNPFLIEEVARALGERMQEAGPDAVRALGPRSVARRVLRRVGALGRDAVALAESVAVLDSDAELRHAEALAALDRAAAVAAADALVAHHVLRPGDRLQFVHPVVRQAVYEQIPVHRRAAMHRAAAVALDGDPGGADRAAVHLLATSPAGDRWAVERLGAAALTALARGAPRAATAFGRRALAEPPAAERHAELLLHTGRAELAAGDPASVLTLSAARDAAADPVARAVVARELTAALTSFGDVERAAAVLRDTVEELPAGAREERLAAEADFLAVTALADPLARRGAVALAGQIDGIAGDTPAERVLLAAASHHRLLSCAPTASITADLALRAAAGGRLVEEQRPGSMSWPQAAMALVFCDRHQDATDLIDAADADARRRGSSVAFCGVAVSRARLALVRGDLPSAEAHARTALEAAADVGTTYREHVIGTLVYALMGQGRSEDALRVLEDAGLATGTLSANASSHTLLIARATLRRELGDVAGAAEDADESLRRQEVRGGVFPRPLASASRALAFQAAGWPDRAREEAAADLSAARAWQLDSAVGAALLVGGLVGDDADRLERLEQAVGVLASTPRRLDHAHALVSYGAELRRRNQRAAAREALADGMDLAARCGARPLAEAARTELKATGARPRRLVLTGAESLTESELRVVRLAADGKTNNEIAQALFVTRKTVETHLHHAFRKLDVRSRRQLAAVLERPAAPVESTVA